jgi:ribokinase
MLFLQPNHSKNRILPYYSNSPIGLVNPRNITKSYTPQPGESLLRNVSIIKPNEIEAAMITGIEVTDQDSAAQATKALRAKGIDIAIVTLGKAGIVINDRGQISHCPACKVDAVDTTAAGDAFTGGLVHMLAQGHSLDQACRFASKVSALSVTKYGAQASMPSLQEVNDFALL